MRRFIEGRRAGFDGDDRTIKVWDLSTYKCAHPQRPRPPLLVSRCSRTAASRRRRRRTLKIWDALSGRRLATLAGHAHVVERVAVLPGGRLASGSHDRSLKVWKF